MKARERNYNKQVDINALTQKFVQYLQNDRWKVQNSTDGQKAIIQAQKAGILRDLVTADRALTFTFENTPSGLRVSVGIGKWLKNIGIMALEAIFLSEIFLFVDVPEMLWTEHVEKILIKELEGMINSM
ncbi:MAG: hypothetical protein KIY12_07420 [Thermoplasmata archaeon]|uniref:Uncharacterized protein n=1 Tax=Candidatus Sysuiplasma superficiale TaxID=2823368 RepID=A0A8J8CEF0_9ARCH|nr:hypothetical protein [Candidatus Sysuiplasma superficiale]MBX8644532.1 hypothetical protein [Candidatus Sysuiplasma superficiale]MCL4346918.1 hypothetical protein [Candidatus Thermoplasmatota archaeon]